MTTLEDRPAVDLAELALAAEVVVSAGYGSQRLVQRKLRVAWEHAAALLASLEAGGILDGPDDEGTWPVLVDAGEAGVILAELAEPEPAELADERGDLADEGVADGAGVDLVKHPANPGDDEDDEPGDELAWPDLEVADASPPGWQRLSAWVRWHAFELAAVATPSVAAVTLHPAWWLAAGGVGARWAALELRAYRHRGGQG